MSVRKLVRFSLLVALSFLLMYYVHFPIPPFPPYLKYDPSEVPALFASFAISPGAGVLVVLVKNVLFFFSGRNVTGIIGVSANFVAGASLVLTAGLIYRRMRTKRGAVISLVAGCLAMTATMAVANYFIFLPLWGIPRDQVGALLTAAIIPFNLVKSGLSSIATFLLYKRIKGLLALDV